MAPFGPRQSPTPVKSSGPAACVVTYTSDVTLRGPLGLLTPLIRLVGKRLVDGNLERLERRIATDPAAGD